VEECRPLVNSLTEQCPRLTALTPGKGSSQVNDLVEKDRSKFKDISQRVEERAKKYKLQRKKSVEVGLTVVQDSVFE
jgi:hypothetical protein